MAAAADMRGVKVAEPVDDNLDDDEGGAVPSFDPDLVADMRGVKVADDDEGGAVPSFVPDFVADLVADASGVKMMKVEKEPYRVSLRNQVV